MLIGRWPRLKIAVLTLALVHVEALAADIAPYPFILNPTKEEDPEQWPATFPLTSRIPMLMQCTGTAVGVHVVITAAHCVSNHGRTSITLRDDTSLKATCYQHPAYSTNVAPSDPTFYAKVSPDFALCLTDSDLPSTMYETIAVNGAFVGMRTQLTLLGFGCISNGQPNVFNAGLFSGLATVTSLPQGASYYAGTIGGSAVCYGDSGGAAYLGQRVNGAHSAIVGIASKGDIISSTSVSLTSLPGFAQWATKWSNAYNAPICGVTPTATHCRPLS